MEYTKISIDPARESHKVKCELEKHAKDLDIIYNLPIPKAAVLMAIFEVDNVPHVILTKRSSKLRVHAGDVSLPGGKVDPSDKDLIDSALRETEEEIGLHRDHIKIIGVLPPIYSLLAKLLVTPVVGYIENIEDVNILINRSEVESVFALPLEIFMDEKSYKSMLHLREGQMWKAFDYLWESKTYSDLLLEKSDSNLNEFHQIMFHENKEVYRIWGITAWMLVMLASFIFEDHYPDISIMFRDSMAKFLKHIPPIKSQL